MSNRDVRSVHTTRIRRAGGWTRATAALCAALIFGAPLAHAAPSLVPDGPGCHGAAAPTEAKPPCHGAAKAGATARKLPCHGAPESATAQRELARPEVSKRRAAGRCCCDDGPAIKARPCGCGREHGAATLVLDPGVPERGAGVRLALPDARLATSPPGDCARGADPPDSPPPVRV